MIGVGGDFKALVMTASNAVLFFALSDHVLPDMIALLCKMSLQTINTIALFGLAMSNPNKQFTLITIDLLTADIAFRPVVVARGCNV